MNRRILVLDDEPGILEAYRIILGEVPHTSPAIVSSRRGRAAAAPAVHPIPLSAPFEVSFVSTGKKHWRRSRRASESGNRTPADSSTSDSAEESTASKP